MLRDSRIDIDFNNGSNEYIYLYLYINRRISGEKSFYQEISRLFPPFVGRSSRIFAIRIRGVEKSKSQHEGKEEILSDQTKAH